MLIGVVRPQWSRVKYFQHFFCHFFGCIATCIQVKLRGMNPRCRHCMHFCYCYIRRCTLYIALHLWFSYDMSIERFYCYYRKQNRWDVEVERRLYYTRNEPPLHTMVTFLLINDVDMAQLHLNDNIILLYVINLSYICYKMHVCLIIWTTNFESRLKKWLLEAGWFKTTTFWFQGTDDKTSA